MKFYIFFLGNFILFKLLSVILACYNFCDSGWNIILLLRRCPKQQLSVSFQIVYWIMFSPYPNSTIFDEPCMHATVAPHTQQYHVGSNNLFTSQQTLRIWYSASQPAWAIICLYVSKSWCTFFFFFFYSEMLLPSHVSIL